MGEFKNSLFKANEGQQSKRKSERVTRIISFGKRDKMNLKLKGITIKIFQSDGTKH